MNMKIIDIISCKVELNMPVLLLLLQTLSIEAEIDRGDGATNNFNIVNQGRINHLNVIMFLEEISLYECANYCIMHLQCQSVSYSSSLKLCELNDIEFDEFEADTDAIGWMNYGTPGKVDGGFSDWKNTTGCSKSCGHGHVTYIRSCDNPKPQHGGANCVGNTRKTEPCFIRHCHVCYGAKDDDYGTFTAPKTGQVKKIRLIHKSGKLMCTTKHGGRWGCSVHQGHVFRTLITDSNKNNIFPDRPYSTYRLSGYGINDDEIVIDRSSAYNINEGQVFKIWDGGDLFNESEEDNSGRHCVLVNFIYE